MLDIIHLAAAKGSKATNNSTTAAPAQGDAAAYLGASHLVVGRCLPLSVAVGASELDGGPLPN